MLDDLAHKIPIKQAEFNGMNLRKDKYCKARNLDILIRKFEECNGATFASIE